METVLKKKDPAASALAKRRWKKTTKKQRKQTMRDVRSHGGGMPRSAERCYCGATSLHTAKVRKFDCCKRAGKFPEEN